MILVMRRSSVYGENDVSTSGNIVVTVPDKEDATEGKRENLARRGLGMLQGRFVKQQLQYRQKVLRQKLREPSAAEEPWRRDLRFHSLFLSLFLEFSIAEESMTVVLDQQVGKGGKASGIQSSNTEGDGSSPSLVVASRIQSAQVKICHNSSHLYR
ncbi:hypothetical protein NE237_027573 [Protea cynaroides]|uniref:Uncharacterized protein n=1 Tax=Protea cynaroides TaxID=273540 RepID=A0A9Q0GPK9_9MAGN|nr:hypothetical protein NE237_027573 [Protea cynaroides]